jgi:dienelactone hydrolase
MHATGGTPAGAGPFAAVVYNHGGLGAVVGGAPVETCRALAVEGFIGVSPIRRATVPIAGHLDDVLAGLALARARPEVDAARIGVLGFSRGGELTFRAALDDRDLDAVVLMAPAPVMGALDEDIARASELTAPALVLVAENDVYQADHLGLARAVHQALQDAGKDVMLIVYPPFGTDGHELFYEVGDYWPDVVAFLHGHLDAP